MRTIIGLAALARSGKDTVASMLLSHSHVAAFALADPLKVGCQVLFGLSDAEAWDDNLKEQPIALWGRSPREFFQAVGTEWMRHHNPDHWLMRAEREINRPANSPTRPVDPEALLPDEAPFILAAQAFFDFSAVQVTTELDTFDAKWGLAPREAISLLKRHAFEMYPDFSQRRSQRSLEALKPRRQVPADAQVIIIKDIRFENEAAFLRRHNGKIWHIKRPDLMKVKAHSSEDGIDHLPEDVLIMNDQGLEELRAAVDRAWAACENSTESKASGDSNKPTAPTDRLSGNDISPSGQEEG
ncbi:deoxynucleoside monophosphate kinase [Pseudomonas sp. 24 E 13]|nr:deoxynucleoside monophosphate kinase [Pseudomonas sp. 24 E 13]